MDSAWTDDPELAARLTLSMVSGIGPNLGRALIETFGSARAALGAKASSLRQVPRIGSALAEKVVRAAKDIDALSEIEKCLALGVRVLYLGGPDYPTMLAEVPDPPMVLYVRGTFEPSDALGIGIVGARKCSAYGLRVAERLGSSLARTGFTVVSGLARGIDAAAHRAALRSGGRTVAVLANGLSTVYPPEHAKFADEIAECGAVVSEQPLYQEPYAELFPQRNRIITGLSLGVLIVEATPNSGTLTTAQHAVEQNREVFAVPGPIDNLSSRGCHRLIRDGATLVESVEDILEALGPLPRPVQAVADEPPVRHPAELTLPAAERAILAELDRPKSVDELAARTGLSAAEVLSAISLMEIRRLIKRLPGLQFVRA